MIKFYVFDRDDTLIDASDHLINPAEILFLISKIHENENAEWAIASSGSTEREADGAYKLIEKNLAKLGINKLKKPMYPQFSSRGGYLNVLSSMDYNELRDNKSEREDLNLLHEALNEIMNSQTMLFKIKNERTGLDIILPETPYVTFQLGKTNVTFDLLKLHQNSDLLFDGDWKLFMIIKALDDAGKTLNLETSPGLEALGITNIESPDSHKFIDAKNVYFYDDKPGCIKLAKKAGFTATHVGAMLKENANNDYLQAIAEHTKEQMQDFTDECYSGEVAELDAALQIIAFKKAIGDGIKNGAFKTGYWGITGKQIKAEFSNNETIFTKVPSGIKELLDIIASDDKATEKLSKMQKVAQKRVDCHQKSGLFFHRPEAAQILYDQLIKINNSEVVSSPALSVGSK